MRFFIAILIVLMFAQTNKGFCQISIEDYTGSSFISRAQDRINVSHSGLAGENSELEKLYLENGKKSKDTVSFKFNDYRTSKTLTYTFVIRLFDQDSILLIPISNAAKKFYNFRKQIWFYRQKYFFDNSISFERLHYCSGIDSNLNSNVTELSIDSNRNIKLRLRSVSDTKPRSFEGKLTDDGYKQLIKFLKTDNIKTLFWPNTSVKGMDPKRLILYFNGQRKELTTMNDTPYIVMNLLLFFMRIDKFSVLKVTSEVVNFEY